MPDERKPNAETQAAIAEVEAGNLESFDTVDKLMADLRKPEPDAMKALLVKMFSGWVIYEASFVADAEGKMHPTTTPEAAMAEACGGDAREAVLLTLFGHWSNDVIAMAAHYGVALARQQPDGTMLHDDGSVDTLLKGGKLTILQIEPPPSPAHFWHAGKWQMLEEPLFKGEIPPREIN